MIHSFDFKISWENIFKNIEIDIRELGYGDPKVNQTMKTLSKIFYDILLNIDIKKSSKNDNYTDFLKKNFYSKEKIKDPPNINKLADYFEKFEDICFDLDVNNMLKGSIDFKFR